MIFKTDEVTVIQSVDRPGLFFVLRPHGPDVTFVIWTDGTYKVLKGLLNDMEREFINNRILKAYKI